MSITINLTGVQETLVSATNIKTINGTSILGSGDLTTADSSLGVADQEVVDATRLINLAGDTSAETLVIENHSGTDIISFAGDSKVRSDANWGFGTSANSTTTINLNNTSTYGIRAQGSSVIGVNVNGTQQFSFRAQNSYNGGEGFRSIMSGTSGTNVSFRGEAITSNASNNIGLLLDVSNSGAGNAYAIDITAGDIKFSQASQVMSLNGDLSSDSLSINSASGTSIAKFFGDSTVSSDARWGFGSSISSSYRLNIESTGFTSGVYVKGSGVIGVYSVGSMNDAIVGISSRSTGVGVKGQVTGSIGTNTGVEAIANSTNTGSNTGLLVSASNGATNYAINIQAGGIKMPSGNTGFTGTGAYTTLTIENGIITNAV